jgi:drug/metabolite transporter (DMT)-like permease
VTRPLNTPRRHPLWHWGILAMGTVAVSSASVLIRLADAPALVVGAWRMLLATALLTPWAVRASRREWRRLDRADMVRLVLAGVMLAVHFAAWISSLSYTTVASAVILVSTTPIWVGLASVVLMREPISRQSAVAIAIALAGTVIVSYGDLALSGRALLGDLLALAGAWAGSAYLLLGRSVRQRLSTLAYVWPCYGIAALGLVVASMASGERLLVYSERTFLIFLLLAIGPQILGHSSFNWALAHFSALFVTIASLGEPIGATLLALVILGEVPSPAALLGGPLILGGIYVASREEAHSSSYPNPSEGEVES